MDNSPSRKALIDWFEQAPFHWVSSRLLKTECIRTLTRDGRLITDASSVLKRVNLIDLTRQIHDTAESFPEHIRTLDALHLATALTVGKEKLTEPLILVSHDKQMLDVALQYGLVTSDPVADLISPHGINGA